MAIWPLKIPELISSLFSATGALNGSVGEIVRIDSPNILRVALDPEGQWNPKVPRIGVLPDGNSYWVQPLFSQFHEGRLLATGLLTNLPVSANSLARNQVVEADPDTDVPAAEVINQSLGGGPESSLVGFVVERSTISAIRFESLASAQCHDGMLVWATVGDERVYYQIVSGETQEESFSSDKHGYQVATATQLGSLREGSGFEKYDWLPTMNTPVFSSRKGEIVAAQAVSESDFVIGNIPRTGISVGGDYAKDFNHHTAILGVTGSGKTEFAFDLIRHAIDKGIKVVCIDLTAQYQGRLGDLAPQDLSINEETAAELGDKLFDVETGTYGAPNEKKALNEFAKTLREQISESIKQFLAGAEGAALGLIRLEEISNTKATLWITELYMTCLLKYAREHPGECPEILIVVEEAHTVMPEPSQMGLGDYDSRGLVGKIAQIALQGRKYGVGLLVLAQRTATVSKTVLTQCNTIISFSCYDDTSLGFLRNIFGPEHVALIPNLPRLHAVAFGNWIRSERPLVFEVPYVAEKDCDV